MGLQTTLIVHTVVLRLYDDVTVAHIYRVCEGIIHGAHTVCNP